MSAIPRTFMREQITVFITTRLLVMPRRQLTWPGNVPLIFSISISGLNKKSSSVLLELDGLRLLTDPPGSYEARGVVLTKHAGPAIALSEIGEIDAVLLSHDQHFDNLDHAGRTLLQRVFRLSIH